MRVLITGANGYIGKSLHQALKNTYEVVATTRSQFDLTDTDATTKFFQNESYFDVIIHCAVVGGSRLVKDDWKALDQNLKMYYNLVQHRDCYEKLIHFSSGAELYAEDTPYGFSKKVVAKSILNDSQFYNIRIFGVFDENEAESRFIKANIKRYINKEPIQIHQNKFMDFFYMADLVKLVEYYIEEENPSKEVDCTYGDYFDLIKIATIINKLDSYEVPILIEEPDKSSTYVGTFSKWPFELIGSKQGIINTYNALKWSK